MYTNVLHKILQSKMYTNVLQRNPSLAGPTLGNMTLAHHRCHHRHHHHHQSIIKASSSSSLSSSSSSSSPILNHKLISEDVVTIKRVWQTLWANVQTFLENLKREMKRSKMKQSIRNIKCVFIFWLFCDI